MIGSTAGNYKIVEKLGEGGMGTVYRGVDQMVERNVAIKVLRADIADNPEVVERFRSEAIALARLNHPAIATLYSFFREGDRYFMAMEFVPGETLEKKIAREGALNWKQAVEIMIWALDGVRHAHQMGILHRDLKPANIMITPDGRVKVTDFGIARVLNTVRLTREARVVGTLEYLAPERALGRPADARSDLYSLGVVFYEMLTGELPFHSDSDFGMMRAQIEQAPQRPRDAGVNVPPEIEAALMKALAKDPEERYPSAEAFAAEFRQAVRATGIPLAHVKATRVAQEQRPAPSQKVDWKDLAGALRRPEARMAGAVAAGLIALGASGIGLYRVMHPRPTTRAIEPAPPPSTIAANAALNVVVPIAPPVVIPSVPAPADQPSSVPSAPEPAAPSPKPRSGTPKREAAPAVSSDSLRAALDETDSGARSSGFGPIHYPGLSKAMKLGGAAASPLVTSAVQARGVNFRATPDQLVELKIAGASDDLLHAVLSGYRGAAPVKTSTPPPTPETAPAAPNPAPAPPPVVQARPAISRLSDVKKLYIVPNEGAIDDLLREELRTQLAGKVDVISAASAADAHLRIDVSDETGNRVVGGVGRIFGLKAKHKAVVRIVEARREKVLWSAEAGDKKAVLGAFSDGERRLASRIAKQLRDDWGK